MTMGWYGEKLQSEFAPPPPKVRRRPPDDRRRLCFEEPPWVGAALVEFVIDWGFLTKQTQCTAMVLPTLKKSQAMIASVQ